jgi:ferric-dicitrate binding protein FerR (iron transport regulator)
VIATGNRNLKKQTYDPSHAFLWKEGILYFEKVPFGKVIAELERWYGVEIEIRGRLDQAAIVSGRFDNDYLDNVLESISYSIPIAYQISQKSVIIQPVKQ